MPYLPKRFKNDNFSKASMPKYEKIIGAKTMTVITQSVGTSFPVSLESPSIPSTAWIVPLAV